MMIPLPFAQSALIVNKGQIKIINLSEILNSSIWHCQTLSFHLRTQGWEACPVPQQTVLNRSVLLLSESSLVFNTAWGKCLSSHLFQVHVFTVHCVKQSQSYLMPIFCSCDVINHGSKVQIVSFQNKPDLTLLRLQHTITSWLYFVTYTQI